MKRIIYYSEKDGFSMSEHTVLQSVFEDVFTVATLIFAEWICKTYFNNGFIVEFCMALFAFALMSKYPRREVLITKDEAVKIINGKDDNQQNNH